MKIFFWKKNNLIDEYAYRLADGLYSTVKPELARQYISQSPSQKMTPERKNQQKIIRELNNVILGIQQFREIHSLGIYGKARLHLTFVQRLQDLGYDKETAEEVNKLVLLRTP